MSCWLPRRQSHRRALYGKASRGPLPYIARRGGACCEWKGTPQRWPSEGRGLCAQRHAWVKGGEASRKGTWVGGGPAVTRHGQGAVGPMGYLFAQQTQKLGQVGRCLFKHAAFCTNSNQSHLCSCRNRDSFDWPKPFKPVILELIGSYLGEATDIKVDVAQT